jgi:Peptidoglycan-binding protein, CsiV
VKSIVAALGAVLAFTTPAWAAAPTPTIYNVEVVVFENLLPDLEGGEIWTREDAKLPNDLKDAINPPEVTSPDSVLTTAAAALTKDGHYRVLVSRHWQQTADAKSETKPVLLESADHRLDGTFRFYLSRFLHVDMNLILQEKPGDDAAATPAFRLSEHRRVKLQDINYFDHPKFGVLVRVTQSGKG